jgi:hypothetical protein
MKFKVKTSYPTIVFINKIDYTLYPDQEIDLPTNDHEYIQTLIGLGYLEPIQEEVKEVKKSKKEVNENAS